MKKTKPEETSEIKWKEGHFTWRAREGLFLGVIFGHPSEWKDEPAVQGTETQAFQAEAIIAKEGRMNFAWLRNSQKASMDGAK